MERRDFIKSSLLFALGTSAISTQGCSPRSSLSKKSASFSDYDQFDGIGLAELVRKGEISAAELLAVAIERVEKVNPQINAVINRMYDQAKTAIASGLPQGPFTGVPFLLKDISATYAGVETSYGSDLLRGFRATHDSEMVIRLKRAGLVIFGKTNMPEFSLSTSTESRRFGPTKNPWNKEMSSGGSSGGSAAAVAAGMVPMAHATDGGGSIRIPSSCCGLFGLKPTRARVPLGPDVGEAWNGSVVAHAITRTVRDSAALLDATSGPEIGDPYWAPPQKRPFLEEVGINPGQLRIAFTTLAWNQKPVHGECSTAVKLAMKACGNLGHHIEEASPPIDEVARERSSLIFKAASTRRLIEAYNKILSRSPRPEEVERASWWIAEYGRTQSASAYAEAIVTMHNTGRVIASFFKKFDVLVTPVMCQPPFKLGTLNTMGNPEIWYETQRSTSAFTSPFNTSGNPAMSVPLHWTSEGMPIGVQFIAPFGEEATLFRLAAQLEAAYPWAHRRPVLHV